MSNSALDRTFFVLHALRNLGPEYFDLKIRLVHQELQDVKKEQEQLDARNGSR